jgi:4-aminobutyrate aminotransferase-like enzyme
VTGTSRAHLARESASIPVDASEETRLTGRVWASGQGAVLTDVDGREAVDLAAGTMTQSIGHCHPDVVAAVRAQAGELENVHDCPTPGRLQAAETLRRLLPDRLSGLAFFSTGAEVVEAALRLVAVAAEPGRRRVAALRRGFHGKTRGARSLVQWDVGIEAPSATSLGYPAYCYRCPFELQPSSCDLLCARLTARQVLAKPDVAALVAEPVQGAAGVIVPPPGYWEIVGDACRRHGVLLVADEVLTGGGRTGEFLASSAFGLEPDLVTLAKGLGSGYPVAVLAGRPELMTVEAWQAAGGFSSTFGGNPVGLAAAGATLRVLERDDLISRVRELTGVLAEELSRLAGSPLVGETRQAGLLAAVELVTDRGSRQPATGIAERVVARAADLGVRLAPGGHVLRLAPPFVIDPDLLRHAVRRLAQAIAEVDRGAA